MIKIFKIEGKFKKSTLTIFDKLSLHYGLSVKTKLFSKILEEHDKLLTENFKLKRSVYFDNFEGIKKGVN